MLINSMMMQLILLQRNSVYLRRKVTDLGGDLQKVTGKRLLNSGGLLRISRRKNRRKWFGNCLIYRDTVFARRTHFHMPS
jgi:hypothetical protein